MWLPEVEGVLSAEDAKQTATRIAEVQEPNGMIPWFDGGHADPWNHTECAMALDIAGRFDCSKKAYDWLVNTQLENGAWYQYYVSSSVEVDRLDANCTAYIATGAWHHYLCTEDESFLEEIWGTIEPAIEFVLGLQTPRGEIIWSRNSDETPESFALLTGSSSVFHSLESAIKVAQKVNVSKPEWELAAEKLGKVIATQPEAFTPKKRWAMDWYYPVLTGAITGEEAIRHLHSKEAQFIHPQKGVKCVSNRPWFTAAETSECAMAYLNVGDSQKAEELLATTSILRLEDGSYYTGMVYPDMVTYPDKETSTYTAAAVLLAADAFTGSSPASEVFLSPEALIRL